MKWNFWVPAVGTLLLCGCAPGDRPPEGTALLDESLALVRHDGSPDMATRDFTLDDDVILVAEVDEQFTDVKLGLAVVDASGKSEPLLVENNLAGMGIELAAIAVDDGRTVRLTVMGAPDGAEPGSVRVRVRRYSEDAKRDSHLRARLQGAAAWTAATDSAARANVIRKTGLAQMQAAIDALDRDPGSAALAAQARLVKAGMYAYFRIDPRESRAEARRAASAFHALQPADAAGAARAQLLEAQALYLLSADARSVNPTSAEAEQQARDLLGVLKAPASALGDLGRARALITLGQIDIDASRGENARRGYEEARAIYLGAGARNGEFYVRCELARLKLYSGQFREAALDFDPLIAEFPRIANPDERAFMYIAAARSRAFSGRGDEALDLLRQALTVARENELRVREANALHGLGNVYQTRGDALEAREFFRESLRISREEKDTAGLAGALELNGYIARMEGDFARAIDLHREAVELAIGPVPKARALRALGQSYQYAENYPKAIATYREALAVRLQDPRHHAYSDIKRNLAEVLIAHGDGSRATLEECEALLRAALQRSLEVGDKQGEIGGYRVLGNLYAARGEFAEAQRHYERAFAVGHEYREKFASNEAREAPIRQEQIGFRDYLDVMLRDSVARGPGRAWPASKREERALRMLESAREGNFGATRTGEVDSQTAARVDSVLARMASTSVKIADLSGPGARPTAELPALQLEMSSLYDELDRVRTAAALKRASAQNFKLEPDRPWRSLAPGTVQLSYALGNLHVYAWARSNAGIQVAALTLLPREIESDITDFSRLSPQDSAARMEKALARLSDVLLPSGLLPANSAAIEIAAEGRIASVPFAGLKSPGAPGRRLVETHAISMITSLFSVEQAPRTSQERPFRLVAVASGHGAWRSGVDPQPKLQAATKEIGVVAGLFKAHDPGARVKLLNGPDGNAAELRNLWSSGADVVHFATHARPDLRQPLASMLTLPAVDAQGSPTYLIAGQVENWRGSSDLVFLSACESAVGPPRFAMGLPGLQRAFLRAGARGVIATLWPIEDVMAQEFSADFYRRYTRGQMASQALGETQRSWLQPRSGEPESMQLRRRITALAHGLYTP